MNTSQSGRNGEPLKFEGEYDFEQANAKFEELEKEFTDKLKVRDDKKHHHHQQQQDQSNTSLSQSQSMNLQDEQHLLIKQKLAVDSDSSKKEDQSKESNKDEDNKNFYDKNISFFDRISCEANDKVQQRVNVKSWKDEKKLNQETFGLKDKINAYNQSRQQMRPHNGSNMQQRSSYGQSRNNGYGNNGPSRSSYGQQSSRPYVQRQQNGGGQRSTGYGPQSGSRRQEVDVDQRQNGSRRFGSR